jgi:hypothetical protein
MTANATTHITKATQSHPQSPVPAPKQDINIETPKIRLREQMTNRTLSVLAMARAIPEQ